MLRISILVAILYFVAGKLAFFLAVPSGYTTLIWPSAGIALAFMLRYGYRVWPGVFLGSLLLNLSTDFAAKSLSPSVHSVLLSSGASAGAVLQAVFGAVLVKKYLRSQEFLDPKDIWKFFLLGGFVSSFIRPFFHVIVLSFAGLIDWNGAYFNWIIGWVSDALGICMFTPLTFLWIGEPREIWGPRKKLLFIPFIAIFSALLMLFHFGYTVEHQQLSTVFYKETDEFVQALKYRIEEFYLAMDSLHGFYASSSFVDRHEFREYVGSLKPYIPHIKSVAWIPKVTRQERQEFVSSVRKEGVSEFSIKSVLPDGTLEEAGERDVYYPILYVEPFDVNRQVLGLDNGSEPDRLAAMQLALMNGNRGASSPITLVQDRQSGRKSIIFVRPVYKKGSATYVLMNRQENVQGFLTITAKIDDVIKQALQSAPSFEHIQLTITDEDTPGPQGVLFSTKDSVVIDDLRKDIVLDVAGRKWKVVFIPMPDFYSGLQIWLWWFVVTGGFLFATLLNMLLLMITGQTAIVRKVVDEKTEALRQEVARHQETEETLRKRGRDLEDARLAALNLMEDAREAEDRFRMVVEGVRDYAIFLLDASGNIVTWNAGAERFKGYKAREVIGKNFSIFYPPEEVEAGKTKQVLKTAAEQGTYTEDGIRIHKNGEPFWARVLITALKDHQGHLKGFSKITQDISELKKQEDKIRQLSLAVEQNPASIIITDVDGTIEYVNSKFSALTGYSFDEAVGQNPRILSSGEQTKEFYEDLWGVILSGQTWRGEFHNKKRDGESYWEMALISPIKDSHGNITHFVAIKEDITQAKESQKEILFLTSYRKAILDNAGFAIISTNSQGKIKSFNPAAEKMLGYRAEEMVDQATPLVFHDKDEIVRKAEALSKELKRPIAPGFEVFTNRREGAASNTDEWTYVRKDGMKFQVLLCVTELKDDEGNLYGYLGLASDISDLKEIQNKLEAAMNVKSEFTSMVSHELRTPLTVIKEGVSIVYDGTAGELNADQKDFLETAKNNVDRLARLINDVLDYQKLEAQQMKFHMSRENINAVVREAGEGFVIPLQKKGVELIFKLAPDLPELEIDKDKIIQVLVNFLNNAMKFTDKGTVVVMTERLDENSIQVSVKDSGIGIKGEDKEKLFKSFSQISTGASRRTGGTGLGLALCKKIVEYHQGKVGMDSVFGEGSTFYFVLPIV